MNQPGERVEPMVVGRYDNIGEAQARIEAASTNATYSLAGRLDRDVALRSVIVLMANAQQYLRAAS